MAWRGIFAQKDVATRSTNATASGPVILNRPMWERSKSPAEVRTAVSFKTGGYSPDYHALATENYIILPWDREVIVDDKLILRPEYAAKLGGQ